MPKNPIEAKTAAPHRDQEQRDLAHISWLVDVFVSARDKEFCEAFAYRLLSAVKAAR